MEVSGYYLQVVSLGFFWVTFHCAGMCGPIIAGITSPGRNTVQRVTMVGAYQTGRAITYMAIGAIAGLVGAAFEHTLSSVTQVAGLVLGGVMVLVGLGHLPFIRVHLPAALTRFAQASGGFLAGALKRGAALGRQRLYLRTFITGALMGLLPCMLMFWVLSVAISTGSALHGAGVMLLLVAMTTPTLTAVACAAHLPFRKIRGEAILPWALILSGVWLGLITAASNGWIEHIHFPFEIMGEKLVIMLW